MKAPTVNGIKKEVDSITQYLVGKGLVDDQNFPRQRKLSSSEAVVDYDTILPASSLVRNEPYADVYATQKAARSYNLLMLDGAMIQMTYRFTSGTLDAARLAFLPSPDLSEYQNNPELYELDTLFSEVVDRRAVTVPLRFDFDAREGAVHDVHHPRSHLTIGQYTNCRIAATAALTPAAFMEFILRGFYNTASRLHSGGLPHSDHRFAPSITDNEARLVHIGIPH